jgi:hypothetical protein
LDDSLGRCDAVRRKTLLGMIDVLIHRYFREVPSSSGSGNSIFRFQEFLLSSAQAASKFLPGENL